MKQVVIAPRAARDLAEAWDYVASQDTAAADRLLARIERATHLLARMPRVGHRRPDVTRADYLFWSVRPYVIAYRIDAARLVVVRILHGRRDVRRLLIG